jgi:hypothetical protein
MTVKVISRCDICGVVHNELTEKHHWSDCIRRVVFSLKDHPAIQHMVFEGDCCSDCAKGLENAVNEFIKIIKKEK